MPGTPDHDVIVVGYGPVGAMLALLLKEAGVRCLVVNDEPGIAQFPKAAHFDDEIVRIYYTVGLGHLSEAWETPPRYQFFDKDWNPFLARLFPQGISDQGTRFDFMFYQPDVEAAMRERLQSGPLAPTLALGERVTQVGQSADAAWVETTDAQGVRRTHTARYIVGCDGASSTVRKSLGIVYDQLAPSHQWYIVDVKLTTAPDPGLAQWEYCNPDRIVTYVPLCGPYRRFEFDIKPGETEEELSSDARTWELLGPWINKGEAVILRKDIYRFHSLLAPKWRDGRVFIAGDAAHLMTPKMGQGLCTGMRDAANLAWKLAHVLQGKADDGLLDTYEADRKGPARQYVELSAYLVNQIISHSSEDGTPPEPVVEQIVAPRQKLGDDSLRAQDDLVGTLSRHPILADGTRMDDLIGYRHALIVAPDAVDRLEPGVLDRLNRIGGVVLQAHDPALAAWLTTATTTMMMMMMMTTGRADRRAGPTATMTTMTAGRPHAPRRSHPAHRPPRPPRHHPRPNGVSERS